MINGLIDHSLEEEEQELEAVKSRPSWKEQTFGVSSTFNFDPFFPGSQTMWRHEDPNDCRGKRFTNARERETREGERETREREERETTEGEREKKSVFFIGAKTENAKEKEGKWRSPAN